MSELNLKRTAPTEYSVPRLTMYGMSGVSLKRRLLRRNNGDREIDDTGVVVARSALISSPRVSQLQLIMFRLLVLVGDGHKVAMATDELAIFGIM